MTIENFSPDQSDEIARLNRMLAMVLQVKAEVFHMEIELLAMLKERQKHGR